MNLTIRKLLTSNGPSRRLYYAARQAYHTRRIARIAKSYFLNADDFTSALVAAHGTGTTDLRTADGLAITIRRNYSDAMTVAEIFLDKCYDCGLALSPNPVILDIGGFIGDFSLYAVKRLNARKVIVCEPSPRNWDLLLRNIANNGFGDRIKPLNKAVTPDGDAVMLDVDVPDECQNMISATNTSDRALTAVSGISLDQLLRDYVDGSVDLLKMDVEGAEYAILENVPAAVLSRIRNIVFEYHDIEKGWARLEGVKQRLVHEGYALQMGRGLVWASRP